MAAADTVDPATAPPVRTITYNVCGAHDCRSDLDLAARTAEIRDRGLAWDTDALMLQELCFGRWAALRDALPGYRRVDVHHDRLRLRPGVPDRHPVGLGVLVKAPAVERYTPG
ncbi:hypothetical protein [Streptomyces sp. NBC_00233]|uniref:hypothetical protein n=1 Tax=Streptomyces sp. NBC_00233 TaxID=2975686 RepID=UPI00225863E1|nr:hypothetical protein [Streptomyces sp. NBC_00233]MCX5226233.1 hypothetical protein [Streptomyces sp. NBC_00233]